MGRPYKLICQAERTDGGKVLGRVRPGRVPLSDPLASVNGANAMVTFEMDTFYGLTIGEQNPDAMFTAYGPLLDIITIVKDNCEGDEMKP